MTVPARLRRALVVVVIPATVGVVGSAVALRAFGFETVPMGPFRVVLSAAFGFGDTDVELPPLGRLRANTHVAPLHVRARLGEVDIDGLQRAFRTGGGLAGVADEVERAALDQLPWFVLRLVLIGTAGALTLAALTFRRRRPIEVGVVAGLVAVLGATTLTGVTFNPRAFLSPRYTGTLSLAPKLFGPVESTLERVGYFRAELQRLVAGAARAYAAIEANPLGPGEEIRVLHISDIHLSTLGYDFALELARSFDVDLVIDTGDTSSFGTEAEAAILSSIPRFGVPYVWVRGNHDSRALQRAVGAYHNAVVLDGSSRTIAGITIYGLGDPYFVSRRGAPTSDVAIEELVRSVDPRVMTDVLALPAPPTLVAVHDDRMAESVAGLVPLVVSGHFHQEAWREQDGTLYLRVGTTGGAGPTGFTVEGGMLSAEILSFERTVGGPRLVAWDTVSQNPDTGSLEIARHLVDAEFGAISPSPAATPSPTGSPS